MEKVTGKRFVAYLIDVIIVSIIAAAFANLNFLNPTVDEYNEAYATYSEALIENEISADALEGINDIGYDLTKYGMSSTIINLVITFLYFVVFQYFNKGKTVGKMVMKINVVSDKGDVPSFIQVLVRSLIVNSILTSCLSIILFYVLSKGVFVVSISYVQLLDLAAIFTCIGLMMFRADGKGLHDIVASTNVVKIEN